jgi:hypothetical protein
VVLLAALLVVHFLSRQHLAALLPPNQGSNYPYVYRTSLALLAGQGFRMLRFSDGPESRPVVEFLNGQRNNVSREEFRRFRNGPDSRAIAFPLPEAKVILPQFPYDGELKTPLSPLHTTRVLDLYTTALLWRIFGIRWSVLLTFCALASTAACLMIFFIGRRLGGGYWPGLFAALLYLAMPLENDLAIRSLRDISPLWFAAVAFAAFVCLVERFRSTPANWAALALTGMACTVGCGWRQDAMILAPFLGAAATVLLLRHWKGWRYLLAAEFAFILGALLPLTAIGLLCPGPRMNPLVSFHMGYYGEFSRCSLFGLENTFQVFRDDVNAANAAQQYHADHEADGAPIECWSPAYGRACFGMYREEISQNLYHWTRGFPAFYLKTLRACRNYDLPINGSWLPPAVPRPRWLKPLADWVLNPLTAVGGWLFALGVCVSFVRQGTRWPAVCLALFSVVYAIVLLFVLPELKHAGPMVLPLTVFGGVGLASLFRLVRPIQLAGQFRTSWRPAVRLAGMAVVVTLLWSLTCVGAYVHSLECRRELLAAVTKLSATGQAAPEALRSTQIFSVSLLPKDGDQPVGYLLHIAAGEGDGFLECRRIHHGVPLSPVPRLLFTRHPLHPNREQYFFVTCNAGTAFGDVRPFICTAILNGDARFLSCTRVDLTDWRRLPLSTLFVPGECDPGNPVGDGAPAVTGYEEKPGLNFDGLSDDELRRYAKPEPAAFSTE